MSSIYNSPSVTIQLVCGNELAAGKFQILFSSPEMLFMSHHWNACIRDIQCAVFISYLGLIKHTLANNGI